MSWRIELENGIYLPDIDWHLDARKPTERSFASHAHIDHLGDHKTILCSPNTAKLAEYRLGGEREWRIHEFGTPFEIEPGVLALLYSAGHILGSSMIYLVREGVSLLYTGDFKLSPELSAENCATPQADILVMETTYGLPRYVFPPETEVIEDIVRFCRETLENSETPVLFGYSLGKSQEILQALSNSGLRVMLHPKSFEMCEICATLGLEFPPYEAFDASKLANHVVISPPLSSNSSWLKSIRDRKTAMISGWGIDPNAIYRFQCDKTFPLSDHSDYLDLVEFVTKVNPKKIYTVHGYTEEFAATLREQGYDALALGKENQMDLGISSDSLSKRISESDSEAIQTEKLPNNSFYRFAEVGQRILATDSKNEKTELLAEYLGSLSTDDAAHAALFFCGRPFAKASADKLNLGWAVVKQAVINAANVSESDFKFLYQNIRDASETSAALLQGLKNAPSRTIGQVRSFFDSLIQAPSANFRLSFLSEEFRKLTSLESKYLMKIISGDSRIGLKEGLVEAAIAKCFGTDLETVRAANLRSGNISSVVIAAAEGHLESIKLKPFHPLRFMLASPEHDASSIVKRLGETVWSEDKYDGVRCQIHKVGERIELFSRDLNPIATQFPEIVEAARKIPQDFVADGELIAWKNEHPLPFSELQKRLGRKGEDLFLGEETPVLLWLYDLLWFNGEEIIDFTLKRRREYLDTFTINNKVRIAPVTILNGTTEIEETFLAARSRGNEGLMLKDPQSVYQLGNRGHSWLKLKKALATLDLVVVAAEYGHGKRKDVLSDYTFAARDTANNSLKVVGKAYTGLTDSEIEELTQHFLENTEEDLGTKRIVKPDIVLEIAFDSIQRSDRHDSGFALRFPRIKRIRRDKDLADIDTTERCSQLCTASGK